MGFELTSIFPVVWPAPHAESCSKIRHGCIYGAPRKQLVRAMESCVNIKTNWGKRGEITPWQSTCGCTWNQDRRGLVVMNMISARQPPDTSRSRQAQGVVAWPCARGPRLRNLSGFLVRHVWIELLSLTCMRVGLLWFVGIDPWKIPCRRVLVKIGLRPHPVEDLCRPPGSLPHHVRCFYMTD
jgi:hypothetical protein